MSSADRATVSCRGLTKSIAPANPPAIKLRAIVPPTDPGALRRADRTTDRGVSNASRFRIDMRPAGSSPGLRMLPQVMMQHVQQRLHVRAVPARLAAGYHR